jgi:hypothetical protein
MGKTAELFDIEIKVELPKLDRRRVISNKL